MRREPALPSPLIYLNERTDMRREPALPLHLCQLQRYPKLHQRLPAKHTADEHSVWLQNSEYNKILTLDQMVNF